MRSRKNEKLHEFSKNAKKPSYWITARRSQKELFTFQNMILGKGGHDGFLQFLVNKMHDIERGIDLDYIEILIREKFLFGKEGETTYIIKDNGK